MSRELIAQIFACCGRDPEQWNGETRKLVELALRCERELKTENGEQVDAK